MNYETLFAHAKDKTVEAALIGVGEFGASLIAQSLQMPSLNVRVLCDQDSARAKTTAESCGIPSDHIHICDSEGDVKKTFEAGQTVVVEDVSLINSIKLDIVVEATGVPEVAARNAVAAIDNGRHVAMVSKEADSVVGPILSHKARAAGLVYTPIDGDQPSLLIGLVTWARVLGLDIVTAGKSSEYDFVFDPANQTISWRDQVIDAPNFDNLWQLTHDDLQAELDARAEALDRFPRRIVPDYCEMGLVCNAIGLKPDRPDFHAPICRTVEVPDLFRPTANGGLLEKSGVVDVFNCLRRPDEASFAGGVFIVVRCADAGTWNTLKGKGIPVSRSNDHALLYNPQHFLGLEAPVSMLSAVYLGRTTGAEHPQPVVDLVGRTTQTLKAGQRLEISDPHHHTMFGVEGFLQDAAPATGDNPAPYYLALHHSLKKDVPAGEILRMSDLDISSSSVLAGLRAEQDQHFIMTSPS